MPLSATRIAITISLLLAMATFVVAVDTEDAIFLYKFKGAIKEDPSQVFPSWRLDSPACPCDWIGVECDVSVLKTGVPVVRGISLPNKDILGTLWKELGRLRFLKTLNLTGNRFQGQLPSYIGDAIVLETLDLSNNAFTGVVPALQKLTYLKTLRLSNNQLEGDFPGTACDGDALRTVDMSNNRMRGALLQTIGVFLEEGIITIHYGHPAVIALADYGYFGRSSKQITLDCLSNERLKRTISKEVFKCSKLEILRLSGNALHGDVPEALAELTRLRVFDLSGNQLTGGLPEAIGQMQYLTHLLLNNNQFTGFITPSISSATYMVILDLSNNQIGKSIPESLGSLVFLERLSLSNNKLQGFIPQNIGKLTSLVSFLDLSQNMLMGSIPSSIGNLERLQKMDFSNNRLSGDLPDNWGYLYSLKILDLSSNRLNGSIPASMQGLSNIQFLNLSHNGFNGAVPLQVSSLITLSVMDLSYNSLTGPVPDWFGSLTSLAYFDGSHNEIIGSLPVSLENLTYIDVFDVSYNKLSGLLLDIPLFRRFAESGYLNNEMGLCGPIFNVTCSSTSNALANIGKGVYKFLKSKEEQLKYVPLLIMAILGVSTLLVLVLCLLLQMLRPKLFEEAVEYCDVSFSPVLHCCRKKARFSYKDLCLATEHFCNRSIIGFGSRYKVFLGQISNGENFAIKVLNRELFWETRPYFFKDCRALAKIKHFNVMQLLDWCYKPSFLALVYKYMPKGSLYDNLYSKKAPIVLTWEERLGIAVDVARGLAYLHHLGKQNRTMYCQLCPSNILLDERAGAKIAGLQVIRGSDEAVLMEGVLNKKQDTRLGPKDYINYLAPECIDEKHINEQAEVYSFGLTILELITRKRSAVGVLSLDQTLPARMRQLFPHRVKQLVDTGILRTTTDSNQVLALIGIALSCTEDNPAQRPDMGIVVSALIRLKNGDVDSRQFNKQPEILEADVDLPSTFAASQSTPFQPFQEGVFLHQNALYRNTMHSPVRHVS